VKMFDADKTGMIGLLYGEKNYDDMLNRFHSIPERDGQTDGQKCYVNKCIGDDTKAAARQSLNCIKNKK